MISSYQWRKKINHQKKSLLTAEAGRGLTLLDDTARGCGIMVDGMIALLDGANGGRGIMAAGALALLDGAGSGRTLTGGGALTLLGGADGGLALVYMADGGRGRGLKD